MERRSDGHPRWRDLVDVHDGVAAGPRGAAAKAHLAASCVRCEGELAVIGRLAAAIAEGPPERPSRRLEALAVRSYRGVLTAFAREAECVTGVLVAGDADAHAVALRHDPGAARRLAWRVGDYEVDAELVAGPRGADVVGQVIPPGDDPSRRVAGRVTVRGARGARATSALAPDGGFNLRGLARGVYAIEGRIDGLAFVLPPVNVG